MAIELYLRDTDWHLLPLPQVESIQKNYQNLTRRTPAIQRQVESITQQWDRIWALSHVYIERYVSFMESYAWFEQEFSSGMQLPVSRDDIGTRLSNILP